MTDRLMGFCWLMTLGLGLAQPCVAEGFAGVFEDRSLTVVVRDQATGATHVHNQERAQQRFTAYSTFKIPNSLIALETGAVNSTDEVFLFDPERHTNTFRKDPGYNRDQTLKTAFKVSAP